MDASAIEQAVIDNAAAVFAVDRAVVGRVRTLAELPTFSSFRLVDLIERVESTLGVEADAALLVPDNLRDVPGLCRVFAHSAGMTVIDGSRS